MMHPGKATACTHCQGTGQVKVSETESKGKKEAIGEEIRICPVCKGTGKGGYPTK